MKARERKTRSRKAASGTETKADIKKGRAKSAKPARPRASGSGAGERKKVARRTTKAGVKTGAKTRIKKVISRRRVAKPALLREPSTPSVERVREEARVLGEVGAGRVEPESRYRLPDTYGQDRAVAMVRDPYWVHIYWEITEGTLSRAVRSLGRAQSNVRRVLRVYTKGGEGEGAEKILFDISITPEARNWYINVGGPGRTYRIDVGLLSTTGKFVCLASSNVVSTPRDRMSDVLDEKWMSLPSEYEEMYALSGGLIRGVSSPQLHERLARELEVRLASPLFSPGIRELPGQKELAKQFWFTLDADLIVYGATVPGSALTINGRDWPLRDDGTFSFRCHLPDGAKEMEVSARSSDGSQDDGAKLKVDRVTRQKRR